MPPCEVCGESQSVIGCDDGVMRCMECAVDDGYDLTTGEKADY
jgi:hypothetical protein